MNNDFLLQQINVETGSQTTKLKKKITNEKRGVKMAEEYDGEITFSSTNSSKEQQNGEQSLQNNFWSLAADIRCPEKQPIVFKGR